MDREKLIQEIVEGLRETRAFGTTINDSKYCIVTRCRNIQITKYNEAKNIWRVIHYPSTGLIFDVLEALKKGGKK